MFSCAAICLSVIDFANSEATCLRRSSNLYYSWPRLFDSIYPSRLIAICILFDGKRDFVPNLYSFFIFYLQLRLYPFYSHHVQPARS
jgi:hypothetical protein